MSKILYSFLLLLLVVSTSAFSQKHSIIKGKISGKIPEKVFYTTAEQGYCFWGFTESVYPSAFGTFKIKLKVKKAAQFVKLWISGKEYTLIAEPGGMYEISCIVDTKEQNFKFVSGNAAGLQKYYNSLPNPRHINNSVYAFAQDTTPEQIVRHVNRLKNKQIAYLEKLLAENKITQAVFNLVKNDRNCYYNTVQGTIALLKMYKAFENQEEYPEAYYLMWKNAFENFNEDRNNFRQSPWYYSYLENYLFFKEYTAEDFSIENLMEIYDKGAIHTHSIEVAKRYLSVEELNFYIPAYLYIAAIQKQFEKELITLYKNFRKEFPKNKFARFSAPLIEDIKKYYFNENKVDTDIRIINNYNQINSLEECLQLFKGHKVFVDVWATWCGECIDEFKNYDEVIKYLQSVNIQILYISTDKNTDDNKWRNMMLHYKLKGYHVRANKQFTQDLRRIYNENNLLVLPWRMLIDENGKIIDKKLPSTADFEWFKDIINRN